MQVLVKGDVGHSNGRVDLNLRRQSNLDHFVLHPVFLFVFHGAAYMNIAEPWLRCCAFFSLLLHLSLQNSVMM